MTKNHNSTILSGADYVFGKEYYSSEGKSDMDKLNIKEPHKPRSDDRQRGDSRCAIPRRRATPHECAISAVQHTVQCITTQGCFTVQL